MIDIIFGIIVAVLSLFMTIGIVYMFISMLLKDLKIIKKGVTILMLLLILSL